MKEPKYTVGDRVVVNNPHEYHGKCHQKHGEVAVIYYRHDRFLYGIRFEDLSNPRSHHNAFWFGVTSLEAENTVVTNESEETTMFENFAVAFVSFLDNNSPTVYSYALYESGYEDGDVVVVHTANHGFALAQIMSINRTDDAKRGVKKGREIVCKVDFSQYNYRQECLNRATELKNSMEAKLREAQTMAIYEMFAEKDPALKEMLDEFKTLQSAIKGESCV